MGQAEVGGVGGQAGKVAVGEGAIWEVSLEAGWQDGGLGILTSALSPQNIMPLSAAMFLSERKNPAPQCPPRLEVQMLMPISWSRMPNHFLQVDTRRAGERLGWAVECQEPLIMMALHIPEENRSGSPGCKMWGGGLRWRGSGSNSVPPHTTLGFQTTL